MRAFVTGIAGGSGSGKSTLIGRLADGEHGPHISLLEHDAYYLNRDQMPAPVREANNWDHPDALDNRLFVEHLDRLRAGLPVERPVYDFQTHSRTAETRPIPARPVVLLDGILLLAIPDIRDRIDLRVYVDTPADERIVRRMMRDLAERGRTVESVAEQYRSTVRPMHDRYVEPSRAWAHLVVPWDWGGDHRPAVEVLEARVAAAVRAATERAVV